MKNLFFILIVLAVVGGAVYLSTSTKSEEAIKTTPAQEKISSVEVNGFEFGFNPHIIGLEVGEKIKLTFKNIGKMSHN